MVLSLGSESGRVRTTNGLGANMNAPRREQLHRAPNHVIRLAARSVITSRRPLKPFENIEAAARQSGGRVNQLARDAYTSLTNPYDKLGLTERQTQVLARMAEGKPNKIICRELNLAVGTVKIHVSAVLKALKVSNRTQAAIAARALAASGSAQCVSGDVTPARRGC